MTPLAHELAKLLPVRSAKDRDRFWMANKENLRNTLFDTHFFEASGVIEMVHEVWELSKRDNDSVQSMFMTYGFLPAPKTWIEWKAHGERFAVLLHEQDDDCVDATLFFRMACQPIGFFNPKTCDMETPGGNFLYPNSLVNYCKTAGVDGSKAALSFIQTAHVILTLINSPKIIGRRQHMPHRGLEKELTRGLGVGKFPLHSWTELKLHVAKPVEIDDGLPHEAHLTGRRALHFCRKHLRIRLGRLEYVRAHWRGDAALGIKQKRYSVEP